MSAKVYRLQELPQLVGQPLGTSDWIVVDQQRIDRFAQATDDHQWIHVDVERAAAGPFGGTVAHGFLTLSLLTRLRPAAAAAHDGAAMEVNYGINKARFLSPVRSGKRVRGRFRTIDVAEKRPGQFQVTVEAVMEIEGEDKPAVVCEWVTYLFA